MIDFVAMTCIIIYCRTDVSKGESLFPCKIASPLSLLFLSYFFTLTSSCIVYVECTVRNDDVSFTRSKRVKKRIIILPRKTSFHAKFQAQCLRCFDIGMACIIMYCQD